MGVRLFFAFVTLAILAAAMAGAYYFFTEVEKPQVEVVREIKRADPPKPIDPGIRQYDDAVALIANRQLVPALEKLRYIIRYFPKSERHADARRLCTQINMDRLLATNDQGETIAYKVQRGDSLSHIAAKHDTTLEYVKRANEMVRFQIHPGDEIEMRRLAFEVTVDTKAKRITLMKDDAFFAEFPIQELTLPSNLRLPTEVKVKSRLASFGDRACGELSKGYDGASKQLRLDKRGLSFFPQQVDDDTPRPSTGFFMDPVDIEELNLLLPVGAPIKIL